MIIHNGFTYFRAGSRFYFGPPKEGVEVVHPRVLKKLRKLSRPKRPKSVRRYRTPSEIARDELAGRGTNAKATQKLGILASLKKRFGDLFARRGR